MASKKRGRGRKNRAIPMAVVAPAAYIVARDIKLGPDAPAVLNRIIEDFTGYNIVASKWSWGQMSPLVYATVGGVIVHKAASRFGVNKHIKKLSMGYLEL